MWDIRLGHIDIMKHRTELLESNKASVHLARYRFASKPLEFERIKLARMLAKNIIKPAEAEWEAPIASSPNKDEAMWFNVDYFKPNFFPKRHIHPIPRKDQ